MVGRGAKGGEGMGRAAAADVLGGWEGMVPASPDHARVAPAAPSPDHAPPSQEVECSYRGKPVKLAVRGKGRVSYRAAHACR